MLTANAAYLPIFTVPLTSRLVGASEVAGSPFKGTSAWCSSGAPNARTVPSTVKSLGVWSWISAEAVAPTGTGPVVTLPAMNWPFQTTLRSLPTWLTLVWAVDVFWNVASTLSMRLIGS